MQFFWKPENGIQVCEIAARFFGYEHELTDMVYGFSIEDLLLNYLYDVPALEQMLDQHDQMCIRDRNERIQMIRRLLT